MKNEGLTIIELVLIAAIIASLVMIVAPIFESSTPKVKIEDEGRMIVELIRRIQRSAITDNRSYSIRFIQGTDTIQTSFVDDQGIAGKGLPVVLERSIDLAGTTFPDDTLKFNILGEPNAAGRVELRNTRDKRLYVEVAEHTGKVTLKGPEKIKKGR